MSIYNLLAGYGGGITVSYLVVAGAGGGAWGNGGGGGGGAGGYLTGSGVALTPSTSYTVTIGAGGTGVFIPAQLPQAGVALHLTAWPLSAVALVA